MLYSLVEEVKKCRLEYDQLESFKNIKEQSLKEAMSDVMGKKDDNGNAEMMALVKGQTLRGYTLASNIIKNETTTETIKQSTERLKEGSRPIFLKNVFQQDFLWMNRFYTLDKEIQSEVFYIADNERNIRICPSTNTVLSGLNTIVKPANLSWSLSRWFMILTSCYTTTSQRIFEDDTLSVFGVIRYNASSDEFTIDDPLGFVQSDGALMTSDFSSKLFSSILKTCLVTVATCASLSLLTAAIKKTYRVYKQLKAKKQALALENEDNRNKIEGAPTQTRSLIGNQEIWVDGYSCRKCKKSPRTILFQPCMHCYLCTKCYEQEPDK